MWHSKSLLKIAGLLCSELLFCCALTLPVSASAQDTNKSSQAESLSNLMNTTCNIAYEPQRVYAANPIISYLMMAMAPNKLVGWNFPPPKQAKGIFPHDSFDKPVIGGWFGQGRTPNLEELIRSKPDLMLLSGATIKTDQQAVLQKLGVPVCTLKLDTLEDYPYALRQLGQWLKNPYRGEMLAKDFEQRLAQLAKNRKTLQSKGLNKSVYYAQSMTGLATECRGSIHSQVLPLAGAINPHLCPNDNAKQSRYGRVDISFEQLLKYNPDAIVTQEAAFYQHIFKDPKWAALKAVQNKQVFFMPQAPFRWMDRPPSFMRVLASQWLMSQLYPQYQFYDMTQETLRMMQDYFNVVIDSQKMRAILNGEIVDERS